MQSDRDVASKILAAFAGAAGFVMIAIGFVASPKAAFLALFGAGLLILGAIAFDE